MSTSFAYGRYMRLETTLYGWGDRSVGVLVHAAVTCTITLRGEITEDELD